MKCNSCCFSAEVACFDGSFCANITGLAMARQVDWLRFEHCTLDGLRSQVARSPPESFGRPKSVGMLHDDTSSALPSDPRVRLSC